MSTYTCAALAGVHHRPHRYRMAACSPSASCGVVLELETPILAYRDEWHDRRSK